MTSVLLTSCSVHRDVCRLVPQERYGCIYPNVGEMVSYKEHYKFSVTRHQHIELLCPLLFQYLLLRRHVAHILHHWLSSSQYTVRRHQHIDQFFAMYFLHFITVEPAAPLASL